SLRACLSRDAWKQARPVLRGPGHGDVTRLPDQWRGLATRYDKNVTTYLAAIFIWSARRSEGNGLALSTQACAYAHAEAATLVVGLADGGTELVRAADIADELVQAFGPRRPRPSTKPGTSTTTSSPRTTGGG
ncbi:hypothetical protein ACF1D2_35280, partial [Streptomyces bacillaris]|uniref:hypothetical protein n=1 Tax=Streptomyces bacillaris TaxID=68179 RepID=UPI0036F6F3DD